MNSLANIIRCIESYKITDPELLNAVHKHIKQQNEIVNTFFIRYSDEMLIIFCKSNAQVMWADIEDNLMLISSILSFSTKHMDQ